MLKSRKKLPARSIRHMRIRKKIKQSGRARLVVRKTLRNIFAQIVDDQKQITLVSASTLSKELIALRNKINVAAATQVGELLGKKAVEKGLTEVVFDRAGYPFHGKIKALAEAARKQGLKF